VTAGLLLAAGAGRRFGGPKALVEVGGRPLAARGVDVLREGGCEPVLVVLGAQADRVRPLVPHADVVVAHGWEEGMGASLRAGLAALEETPATACVVALVDQPRVTAAAVARLAATAADAAVATYAGRPRNPVLLGRAVWAEVCTLAVGDTGARAWLRANPSRVVAVPCDDVADPADVDTPADLSRLLEEPA
jgi:CTP:molybdopterin cytidylyltransferase MocA